MRVLIAGCGDVGSPLGAELATAGHEVWGFRRRPAGLPAAIRPLRADLTRPATLAVLPPALDVVVYTAAPGESTDPAYRATYVEGLRALLQTLAARGQAPRRIVFTSSTAVQLGGVAAQRMTKSEVGAAVRGARFVRVGRIPTGGGPPR